MPEPVFEKNKFFETKILNFETKRLERQYFKILSIRVNKEGDTQGFRVQRYEFKRVKTIVVPIDDGIYKKLKIQDVYELQQTYETPIYFKYNYMHWKCNYLHGSDRILNDDELTKYMER